jgi:hypothetical protein
MSQEHLDLITRRRRLVLKYATAVEKTPRGVKKKYPSTTDIARAINTGKHNIEVTVSTVRRDLIALGFRSAVRQRGPKREPGDEKKRIERCKYFLSQAKDLKKIHFSDEKTFNTNDHGCRTEWVREGEAPSRIETTTYNVKTVKVWGAIGHNFKFLVFLPKGLRKQNTQSYKRCLIPYIKDLQERKIECIFQYDGDRSHSSGEILKYLESKNIKTLPVWPARSPDMSPIENLWACIARRVDSHGPTDYEELKRFIKAEWDNYPMEMINRMVASFGSRCKKVIECKGRTIDTRMRRK